MKRQAVGSFPGQAQVGGPVRVPPELIPGSLPDLEEALEHVGREVRTPRIHHADRGLEVRLVGAVAGHRTQACVAKITSALGPLRYVLRFVVDLDQRTLESARL